MSCLQKWLLFIPLTSPHAWTNLPVIQIILGEGNGTPFQYSCLENPMDGGACQAAVHGVAKSRTWLSDFTFTFHFPALENKMATHSSVRAWRIPGTEEPGGLPSMGSHRVGHDWSDLAAAAAAADYIDKTLRLACESATASQPPLVQQLVGLVLHCQSST